METTRNFAEEVNKVICNHKPAKINTSALVKSQKGGGLEMNNFIIFDKAIKVNWVKRLCLDFEDLWR